MSSAAGLVITRLRRIGSLSLTPNIFALHVQFSRMTFVAENAHRGLRSAENLHRLIGRLVRENSHNTCHLQTD
jgi:hypothetical protein